MANILVLGSGQLGTALLRCLPGDVYLLDRAILDITDGGAVERVLSDLQPRVLINTAAYNRVDEAESRPDLAFAVNATAAGMLARTAVALGIPRFVHISTDYVFSGDSDRAYREDDMPGPLSVYGTSKLAGEHLVRAYAPQALVVRTSGVFGILPQGARNPRSNFVQAIVRQARAGADLRVVTDQRCSPTYAADLARMVLVLVRQGASGLVHVTNSGSCSWFDFAEAILDLAHLSAPLQPVSSAERPTAALRPRYSVLDPQRLHAYGGEMPHWRDGLERFMAALTMQEQGG